MRRLLGCLVVSCWLLACGGSDEPGADLGSGGTSGGSAGGTGQSDSGPHADTGSSQAGGGGGVGGSMGTGGIAAGAAGIAGAADAVSPDVDAGAPIDVSVAADAGSDREVSTSSDVAVGSDAPDVSVTQTDAAESGSDAGEASAAADTSTIDAQSCNSPTECPTPSNVCLVATCDGATYTCGTAPAAQGVAVPTQTAGDCKKVVCNGSGSTQSVDDDGDAPSDGNPCTTDGCSAGVPTHTPVTTGTTCSGGFCNAQGNCVECLGAATCGTATACSAPTCNDGACGVTYTAVDTPIATQIAGDCKVKVCDGVGGIKENDDPNDKPDDSNACTDDTCNGNVPVHTPRTGQSCGVSGVCSSQGTCVGCNNPSDCGADDFCKTRTCVNNTCGISPTAANTKLPDGQQTDKDCKKQVCDGLGGVQTVEDPSDLPIDGNDCTIDQCAGSTPQNVFSSQGTPCSSGVCDGAGSCVQCLGPADCPATGNSCTQPACDNTHHCGTTNKAADTPCGAGPSCGAGHEHLQDKCSSGSCVAGADVACSPYACGTAACKTACSGDGDCAGGNTCDTGVSICTNGPKCTDYCNSIMANCTGSNAQYFSTAACLKACLTLPRGAVSDGAGNTVGCRITHAGLAAGDPVLHCPHAGPGGAGVCSTNNCEGFCTIALGNCTGVNQVWATKDACMVDCAIYATTPTYNASITSGNSFACRMYHLTAAGLDPVTHCPHIQPVSAACF